MGTKAKTSQQRQAAFLERQKAAGAQRLSVFVSGAAHAVLKRQAVRDGVSVAKLVERLALDAHATRGGHQHLYEVQHGSRH